MADGESGATGLSGGRTETWEAQCLSGVVVVVESGVVAVVVVGNTMEARVSSLNFSRGHLAVLLLLRLPPFIKKGNRLNFPSLMEGDY